MRGNHLAYVATQGMLFMDECGEFTTDKLLADECGVITTNKLFLE